MRFSLTFACFALASLLMSSTAAFADDLPNILWISSEDNGQQLGCYGDEYADTPNLDAFAATGMRYATCWSNAPVCAPARTTVITGMYPPSTGSQHMRSTTQLPSMINGEAVKMFPAYLRELGYYCTNASKEDYNLDKTGTVWDQSSGKAHWKNRAEGQPFFAVFNETISHESKIRSKPHELVHDPAGVRVPAYHPDIYEVRRDWAQYYDKMTEMDRRLGKHLKDLDKAGLAEDTIVVYWGDHGSGMPRSKRTPLDSGLRVPLIVRFPDKFKHLAPSEYEVNGVSERLVSFVDLAPTMLSIAGIEPPKHMQGHAFAGTYASEPQPYVYGFRGRMDERPDFVRSITDGRYVLVRNFLPHIPHGQHVDYQMQTTTTRVWKEMYDAGELNAAQSRFWMTPREPVEFYDRESDPDEVNNLFNKGDADVNAKAREMLAALSRWQIEIRDLGFLPEGMMHGLAQEAGVTPYEYGHSDAYDVERMLELTRPIGSLHERPTTHSKEMARVLIEGLHPAERYWAAIDFQNRPSAARTHEEALLDALEDPSDHVRIAAAEALATHCKQDPNDPPGVDDPVWPALTVLREEANYENGSSYAAVHALNSIDRLGEVAKPILDDVVKVPLPAKGSGVPSRAQGYPGRMVQTLKKQGL